MKIFSFILNPNEKRQLKNPKPNEIKRAKNYYHAIKETFNTYPKLDVQIISNDRYRYHKMDLHDRVIQSNFLIVECGIGFNSLRRKKGIPNNSRIDSHSIFESPQYYKRINKLIRLHENYLDKLRFKDSKSSNFLFYP